MSRYSYPSNFRFAPLEQQCGQHTTSLVPYSNRLTDKTAQTLQQPLPKSAEAWIRVPSPLMMAERSDRPLDWHWPMMNRATCHLLDCIDKRLGASWDSDTKGKLIDFCLETLGPEHTQFDPRVVAFYEQAAASQQQFLPVAVQLGNRWRGESPKQVDTLLSTDEIPMDLYTGLICLLAHWSVVSDPKTTWWIDTPGTRYSPKADGRFDDATYFDIRNGLTSIDWNWDSRVRSQRAIATIIVPKSLASVSP